MTRAYTPAEESWLREHYHAGTIDDTCDAFEAEFGRRPSRHALFQKAERMGLRKDRRGAERHVPAQMAIRWSEPAFARMREWMLANDAGGSVQATIDAFEREFGVRLNLSQVSCFRSTHGTSKRKAHGGGKPSKPVGSERMGRDGYIMVKVREWPEKPCSKDNWRFKHHLAYEEAHGPIPKGHVVLFADHDRRNFDPDNLVAIPRKYLGQLNNPKLPSYNDRGSLLACIALCDLQDAAVEAWRRLEHRCAVCGERFVPTRVQAYSPDAVKTCQACLAEGRKGIGKRKGARA